MKTSILRQIHKTAFRVCSPRQLALAIENSNDRHRFSPRTQFAEANLPPTNSQVVAAALGSYGRSRFESEFHHHNVRQSHPFYTFRLFLIHFETVAKGIRRRKCLVRSKALLVYRQFRLTRFVHQADNPLQLAPIFSR